MENTANLSSLLCHRRFCHMADYELSDHKANPGRFQVVDVEDKNLALKAYFQN